MARYHINPLTGNPAICSAKIKCRFGGMEHDHYDSKEEAREAYERSAEISSLAVLDSVKKLSYGAKLLRAIDRAQAEIEASSLLKNKNRNADDYTAWYGKIRRRDYLQDKLRGELPWDDTDAPSYDPNEEVEAFAPVEFDHSNTPRQGYTNDISEDFDEDPASAKVYARMDHASSVWIKRLSTAEIKALVQYNSDASTYAEVMAGAREPTEDEKLMVKYLHSALEKAPKTKEAFISYSGINEKRVEDLEAQLKTGTLDLARLQSASANPAQVNGFTHFKEEFSVALEIRQTHLASLTAFNVHRGELELLIPPGRYEVKGIQKKVEYLWPGGLGRTTERVYQIESA